MYANVFITLLTPDYEDKIICLLVKNKFILKNQFIDHDNNEGAMFYTQIMLDESFGDISNEVLNKYIKNMVKIFKDDILYHSIVIHTDTSTSYTKSNINIKNYNKKRLINLLK